MNRSSNESILRNDTFLLVQNAYIGFSHPGARKTPREIKRVVKSGGESDGYTRLTQWESDMLWRIYTSYAVNGLNEPVSMSKPTKHV